MALPYFLGIDLSTQQLKALVIDSELNVIHEASVHFDKDLSEFETQGGVHKHEDNLAVTAPTLLWVKACDFVLGKLKAEGLDFGSVACVSGTGQQHGSVYWKKGASDVLRCLKKGQSLYEQLKVHFCVYNVILSGMGIGGCWLIYRMTCTPPTPTPHFANPTT